MKIPKIPSSIEETVKNTKVHVENMAKEYVPKIVMAMGEVQKKILNVTEHTPAVLTFAKQHWKKVIIGGTIVVGSTLHQSSPDKHQKFKEPTINMEALEGRKITKVEFQKIRTDIAKVFPKHAQHKEGKLHLDLKSFCLYNYNYTTFQELHPLLKTYLLSATFDDLRSDNVIPSNGEIMSYNYLSLKETWAAKTYEARKTDEVNKDSVEIAKKNALSQRQRKITLKEFYSTCKNTALELQKEMKKSGHWKTTEFDTYFAGETLFTISVHEIIPTDYHPQVKPQIMRAMLDAGWQINLMPAVHDGVSSFNPYQMCKETHDSVAHRHISLFNKHNIPVFEENLDLKKQTIVATLLMFDRAYAYKKDLLKKPHFMKLWRSAKEDERYAFTAGLSGGLHNGPYYADKGYDQMIANLSKCRTLHDARLVYINGIPPSYTKPHAIDTGNLAHTFANDIHRNIYRVASTLRPQNANKKLDLSRVASEEPKKTLLDTQEITLLVREHNGIPYHTYTLPDMTIGKYLSLMCEKYSEEEVRFLKEFNDKKRFAPGDPIRIPKNMLRKNLRNEKYKMITIPENNDPEMFLKNTIKTDKERELLRALNGGQLSRKIIVPKDLTIT